MTTLAEVFDALKYRVDVDPITGTRKYYNDAGQLHRVDDPAVVWRDGGKEWWQNGQRHRIDGPAVEYADGGKEWWINGKSYTKQDYQAQL